MNPFEDLLITAIMNAFFHLLRRDEHLNPDIVFAGVLNILSFWNFGLLPAPDPEGVRLIDICLTALYFGCLGFTLTQFVKMFKVGQFNWKWASGSGVVVLIWILSLVTHLYPGWPNAVGGRVVNAFNAVMAVVMFVYQYLIVGLFQHCIVAPYQCVAGMCTQAATAIMTCTADFTDWLNQRVNALLGIFSEHHAHETEMV